MTTHLAIVLPGRGYGALGPALRLPCLAVEELGSNTFVVEYPSDTGRTVEGDRWRDLHSSVADQIASVVSRSGPERITFIAKSLGTVLLAGLSARATLSGPTTLPTEVEAIWITPIFGREQVRSGAIAHGWRSLLVAGAADEFHEAAHHDEVTEALGASSLVLPRANHLLEVPGDVRMTLAGFRSLTEAVLAFVGTTH